MKSGRVYALVFLVFGIGGCQTESTRTSDASITVQSWTSPGGNQVILRTPSENRTDYFDNDKNRICFHFSAGGMWNPTNERGLLVSNDGRDLIGVLMLAREDLEKYSGNDLLKKAISMHIEDNKDRLESFPVDSHIDDIETKFGRGVEWTGEWKVLREGQDLRAVVIRWLVKVDQDWIAAITASPGSGGGEMATKVIHSLEVRDSPGCYWPRINPVLSAPCHQCGS